MFSINRSMLLDLGKAITSRDIGLAKDVIVREREIDRLYFLVVRQLKSAVEHQQKNIQSANMSAEAAGFED